MAANGAGLRRSLPIRAGLTLLLAGLALGLLVPATTPVWADTPAGDWPKYVHDNNGSGFTEDARIAAASATSLHLAPGWPVHLGGTISTQPLVANGLIYVGAWDGYEYALDPAGIIRWKTYLGRTTKGKACQYPIGVASTGVVATNLVGGRSRSVLYVGGGGNEDAAGKVFTGGSAELYAIDALSGAVLWHTALGPAPDSFMWSSPALYHGSVYVGLSAFADCPLIQGKLFRLDASTGDIQHAFDVVKPGCIGGSIWGSPSISESEGAVYVATGNPENCSFFGSEVGPHFRPKRSLFSILLALAGALLAVFSWTRAANRLLFRLGLGIAVVGLLGTALFVLGPRVTVAEPYTIAVLKLGASDLKLIDYWHIPESERTRDGDFGTTPTLFTGTVTPGGTPRALLGAANKNGTYYVFDRTNLSAGPVARLRVATGGDPPTSGNGSISPSAFDGRLLYIAGGSTTVGGNAYPGSLSAFDPGDLVTPVWRTGIRSGPVLAAVTAAPGLAVIGAGDSTIVVEAAHGSLVFQAAARSDGRPSVPIFFGAPTIANGTLYEGDTHGNLYAYTVAGS